MYLLIARTQSQKNKKKSVGHEALYLVVNGF